MPERRDFAGCQIGHFRVIERIGEATFPHPRAEDRWRCLCDVCGEWREIGSAALARAETRERCLGIKTQCRRCAQKAKQATGAFPRPRRPPHPEVSDDCSTPAQHTLPASDRDLAVAIAARLPIKVSYDESGWPCLRQKGTKATRFDPANDWNDALLALREVLGENGDSPCRTFYRDLEFVLAGSTAILPDWPHAFGLLVEQGPRSVCAAILRCCPVIERSTAVVRS